MKIVAGLLSLFITAPIWFYLLYKVLAAVGASDLMWFLYWTYVPVSIFASVLLKLAED